MASRRSEPKKTDSDASKSTGKSGKRTTGENPMAGGEFPDRAGNLLSVGIEDTQQTLERSMVLDQLVGKSAIDLHEVERTRKIIGRDDRVALPDSIVTKAPFSWICSLIIHTRFGTAIGTGWLVGPRTVITAGHCVFDKFAGSQRTFASSIDVIPAMTPSGPAFDLACTVDSSRLRTTNQWMTSAEPTADVAAILLPRDFSFGDRLGYFGFAAVPTDELDRLFLNISGYPHSDSRRQYWHADRAKTIHSNYFFYEIDTEPGQSGSPVYYIDESSENAYVVGIHTRGGSRNYAVRIDEEVYDLLAQWKDT